MNDAASGAPLLDLDGLTKDFPGVRAVDGVGFSVGTGEIHALLGENGAGKSTLVKMIYGVLHPDAGSMRFAGRPFAPRRPADARRAGVGMVFQHFSLFEALTVTENVALGLDGAAADAALAARILDVARAYGLDVHPERLVGTLSVGERQRVEIVRCLLQDPRLIIMDEPTSVLTPQEATALFGTLRKLAAEGRSILYISHKLEEIRALCHAATVLRGGKLVARCDPTAETVRSLAEMMIGTTLKAPERGALRAGAARLEVRALALPKSHTFGVSLDDVTFTVHAGEIQGIAGVAGNGQDELMEAMIGERLPDDADAIRVDGKPLGRAGPRVRREAGMSFVPEERLGHGAVPGLSLAENILLSSHPQGMIDWSAAAAAADRVIGAFGVKARGSQSAARSLSGGNLQKFIVGREISRSPAVLVVAQPTWGVDAGAAALIHERLIALTAAGTAVVVVSQDLDELFAICHRIAVMAGGRLSPARDVASLSIEQIGLEMGAASREEAAHA
jgi:simple sugar transport system ATP-binding protein